MFVEGGKPENPEKNPRREGQEPTINSTHIRRRVRESNPGHIGWRRVLSPLRHPCCPKGGLRVREPRFQHLVPRVLLRFYPFPRPSFNSKRKESNYFAAYMYYFLVLAPNTRSTLPVVKDSFLLLSSIVLSVAIVRFHTFFMSVPVSSPSLCLSFYVTSVGLVRFRASIPHRATL